DRLRPTEVRLHKRRGQFHSHMQSGCCYRVDISCCVGISGIVYLSDQTSLAAPVVVAVILTNRDPHCGLGPLGPAALYLVVLDLRRGEAGPSAATFHNVVRRRLFDPGVQLVVWCPMVASTQLD